MRSRPRRSAVTRGLDAVLVLFESVACILLCIVTTIVFSIWATFVVSPRYLHIAFVVGFVLITGSIVAATRVRAKVRRLSVIALGGVLSIVWALTYEWNRPTPEELQHDGEAIVLAIVDYHAFHGVYPMSLEAAYSDVSDAPYGGWQYDPAPRLSIGVYEEDDFELSWTPGNGWYLDM